MTDSDGTKTVLWGYRRGQRIGSSFQKVGLRSCWGLKRPELTVRRNQFGKTWVNLGFVTGFRSRGLRS